jgi:hypothetical protein
LMALGGIVAVCGLLMEPVPRAIALVGAAIIAPGFEPLAKLAEGLGLLQRGICLRALSAGVGDPRARLTAEPILAPLTHLEPLSIITSACAAVAGVVMVVSLRDFYVVGPLMVLVTISGIALAGGALAVGEFGVVLSALKRVGVDAVLLLLLGAGVFYWKQRSFHRRRPIS